MRTVDLRRDCLRDQDLFQALRVVSVPSVFTSLDTHKGSPLSLPACIRDYSSQCPEAIMFN